MADWFVKHDSVAFKVVIFFLTLELQKSTSLRSFISVAASTRSKAWELWVMWSWMLALSIGEPHLSAAVGVLSFPWFEAFQGDCCERHPYGLPAITTSTVYWGVMGRRVTCDMCMAFILTDQTWQWQYVSVLLIWLKLSTAANSYQN